MRLVKVGIIGRQRAISFLVLYFYLKSIHGYKRIRSQVLGNNYKVFYFSSLSFNRLYNNLTTLMENNNIAFRINNKSSLQIIFSKKKQLISIYAKKKSFN